MFGTLEVDVGGARLGPRDFGGVKPRQLLEILLCERGRTVAKDRLADLLWGEQLPANVAATLETYVSNVRRQLGGAKRESPLVTEPGAYRIDPARLPTDLDEFDALVAVGTRTALDTALELVTGEALANEPYGSWALRLREVYRARHIDVLLRAAELMQREGDYAVAVSRAQQVIDLDAACERGHRAVMAGLRALGRTDEAVRAFQRCKQALRDELGVDPQPETLALRDAIAGRTATSGPVRSAPRPPVVAVELPFVGRRGELTHLERVTRAALAGAPALLLVEGEAGIGKSRLLDELGTRFGDVRIVRTKCFPLDAAIPFAPLATLVRQMAPADVLADATRFPHLDEIVPELAAGASTGGGESRRARALESLVALVRTRAPMLFVVDDLHWADASTLSALDYLCRRGGATPFAIAGSFRTEQAPSEHPVRHLSAVLRLELPPLQAADLIGYGDGDLHARTGGNPLYIVECLRAADATATPSLRELILARSRFAGADAHRLLVIAALLGRSFDPEALAEITGDDPDHVCEELERLCEHRLLRSQDAHFDFRHDLVRETLGGSLSVTRRRRLLARAVEVLETRGADPGELAAHAEAAGDPARALRYATIAGEAARDRFANAEAVDHFARAIRLVESTPAIAEPGTLEGLLVKQVSALTSLRRHAEAHERAQHALALAEASGDDRRILDVLEVLVMAQQFGASDPLGALATANRALEVAERAADPDLLARAHALVGGPSSTLGKLDDSLHHMHEALAHADKAGRSAPAFPLGRIAMVLRFRARDREAIDWTLRAEQASVDQHDGPTRLMARWVRALCQEELGRTGEAWATLASMHEIGGDESVWQARVPNTFGSFLASLCLHERAMERDLEALEIARGGDSPLVKEAEIQTCVNLAADRVALGRLAEARTTIEWVRGQTSNYARFRWMTRMHAVDAELAVAEGDPERARSAADACLLLADKYGQPKHVVRGKLAAAAALAAAGQTAAARRTARAAATLADEHGLEHLSWRAWDAAGDHDRARGSVVRIAEGLYDSLRREFLRVVSVKP